MLNQFSRTQLLLGEDAMKKLADMRVAVFGIGGVGGYVCEALVRSGIGHFDLIDDDKVCLTNINRQIIATRKTIGKYAYINTQGYILEIAEDNKKMPIIQGISTSEEEVIPGKRLNNDDLNKLEDVIKILDSANENGLDGKVTSIDISNKNEYSIYIEEENKKVHLGDSTNLSNKMLYVMAIIEAEKGKQGDIFVNGDLNNKFQPYFREKV